LGLKEDLVYRIAKRWVSGESVEEAMNFGKADVNRGLGVVFNYLGEDVTEQSVAERHALEYLRLQRLISESGLRACVSVKLTQLGLASDEALAAERVGRIASSAASLNQFLWIDMESSSSTDATLKIYSKILEENKNVGVALQAYLRRSEEDLYELLHINGRIRLVKGAYRESPDLVYTSRKEVTENFSKLMDVLFGRTDGFAIATHDSRLIHEATELADSHKVKFEFQMLKGIRDDLKPVLVKRGYRVVDYVPYGEDWYHYSIRRVREHPSNIWLLLRSLL
jgi:proline dehydrogenase